jgi:Mn2+/Fe2+ NRAMP family transporter
MISDIVYTNSHIGEPSSLWRWAKNIPLSYLYYGTIVAVVVVGAALIPLREPLTLLVISGVLGGLTMAIYTPFLVYLNNTRLPKPLRPSWFTNIVMICISAFFIFFAGRVILSYFL